MRGRPPVSLKRKTKYRGRNLVKPGTLVMAEVWSDYAGTLGKMPMLVVGKEPYEPGDSDDRYELKNIVTGESHIEYRRDFTLIRSKQNEQ